MERYPDIKSKTTKSTKENGKPKDGKGGKDTQAEFITPAHHQRGVTPVTEWAGMTDWVVAMITRSPGKVEEDKRWEVAKNLVCRNDPLGSGLGKRGRKAESRKREEVAKGRGPERPIEAERWRRSRKMVTEEARRVGEPYKRLPRTEWAGMTDWVQV